ncbi:MAG TPA: Yip1 family protein [Croceibacterium sp.]
MVDGISGAPAPAGLVERIKAILLKPKDEWPKIAADPAPPGDIVTRYAIPLIAIGPVASFVGGVLFRHVGVMGGLGIAIGTFVMGLVALVAVTFIAEFLAPKFGGEANRRQAFKWVAFGATASWVGGIFGLLPDLWLLGLLAGAYSLYLLYLGATPVMKVPEDKAVGYTAVTVVAAVVLMAVASAVTASVAAVFGGGAALVGSAVGGNEETVAIPGLGSIDTDRMEQAAERMERMASGEIKPLTPAQLTPLLPASIGSYARVATSSASVGMGSQAEATYEAGEKRFALRVTDMAAMGGFAGMANAMGVEYSKEDADGYERVFRNGDQMMTEKWSKSGSSGTYGVVVADRFMIEADGQVTSIDELKAAVATVDQDELADLGG